MTTFSKKTATALLLTLILSLGSCSTVQITCRQYWTFDTRQQHSDTTILHATAFDYGPLIVAYRLDAAGGGCAGFQIHNTSDSLITIDLEKTFFIKNGAAFAYYEARSHTYTSGNTQASSQSVSAGNSQSVLLRDTKNRYHLPGIPAGAGEATFDRTHNLYSGLLFSNSTTQTYSTTRHEQKTVFIPPHSYKSFVKYRISDTYFRFDTKEYKASEESPASQDYAPFEVIYTHEDTPFAFSNYITYHIGADKAPKTIKQTFYLQKITNCRSTCPPPRPASSNTIYIEYQRPVEDSFRSPYYEDL